MYHAHISTMLVPCVEQRPLLNRETCAPFSYDFNPLACKILAPASHNPPMLFGLSALSCRTPFA